MIDHVTVAPMVRFAPAPDGAVRSRGGSIPSAPLKRTEFY